MACDLADATVDNPSAAQCILDALAQRADGHIQWSVTSVDDPGWAWRNHELWTSGDEGFYAQQYRVDLWQQLHGVRRVQLRSAEEFAACRDATTSAEQLECLVDPWTEVLDVVIPSDADL